MWSSRRLHRLLLVLLCVALPALGEAAAAFDAVGTVQHGVGTAVPNIPITVGSGANRAIICYYSGSIDTANVSFSGAGASGWAVIAGTNGTTTTGTVMWGATAPAAGAQTVTSPTLTNSQNFVVDCVTFTGVNQATPFNNGTFAGGANPQSVTITSTSGDLTTSVSAIGNDTATTPVSNQGHCPGAATLCYADHPVATSFWGSVDLGPGTGTTTHTWTPQVSINGFVSGANVVQSSGGAVVVPMRSLRGVGQ